MTKRKDWPEAPETAADELALATLAALDFIDGMIAKGGHAGPASDLTALAARLRAAVFPADT